MSHSRYSSSMLASILLVLVLLSTKVHSQTDMINYCGEKPCIEPLRMSCEEMIETYEFQGSCCSMEVISATGGCRISVTFGNCFWYPWCGDCDESDEVTSRCNNIFETDADQRPCPAGDFDPIAIQAQIDFERPSCAPTMAPVSAAPVEDGSSASTHTDNVVSRMVMMTGAVGILVAAAAGTFAAV